MVCSKCGNNIASFHSTISINGVVKEEHLCSSCAKQNKNSLFSNINFGFFDNIFNPYQFSYVGVDNLKELKPKTLIDEALTIVNIGAKKYKEEHDKLSKNDCKINNLKYELFMKEVINANI